jgi:signal transduction histidine kinase
VQEATNNCLKHAEASLIMVDLELRDGKLHLEVEDDGKGFDVESTLGSSFGLIGMRERLQHAGGRFSVQSEIGIGTVVSAELRVVRVRAKEVLDGFRISSLPG